jgi:outer membrane immunogenic protein
MGMFKKKTLLLATTALAMGFIQHAAAADLPVKAAPYVRAPAFNWTGFYFGGHAGAGFGTSESTLTSLNVAGLGIIPGAIGPLPLASHNVNGFIGGGQVGYNWQFSPVFVAGIEGDFSWSGMEGDAPCLVVLSCGTKVNWVADITGRVGFTVDRALIYLKGGAAWADTEYSVALNLIPGANFSAKGSDTRFGGLLGLGVEYAVTRNWSAKVEYNYIDFGSHDQPLATTVAGVPLNATASVDQQLHIVKAGVNYRFNWGGPEVPRY